MTVKPLPNGCDQARQTATGLKSASVATFPSRLSVLLPDLAIAADAAARCGTSR